MNDVAKLREQSYEIFLSLNKMIKYLFNMNITIAITTALNLILIILMYGKYNQLSEKVEQNILNEESHIEGVCFE